MLALRCRVFALLGMLLWTVACTTQTATRDDLASIAATRVLRVGVAADSPPFGMQGPLAIRGFDVDIITAIAERLGATVALTPVSTSQRIEALTSHRVDCVIASMTITRTREHAVDFSVPYFQDGQALLVREGSAIADYRDLAGKKVGVITGSTGEGTIRQVAPDCVLVPFANKPAMRDALLAGTVEAITSDMLILHGLKRGHPLAIAGARFSTEPYGIAVRQGQSALRDAINDALMDMWESGQWRAIYDAWFGVGTPYETEIHFSVPVVPR